MRGEKLALVEHSRENCAKPRRTDDGKQPAILFAGARHRSRVTDEIRTVVQKPGEALVKSRQLFEEIRIDRLDGQERDEPDHRSHPNVRLAPVG